MKTKYLVIALIFFSLGIVVGMIGMASLQSKGYKEEIELTSEMKEYADKLDKKGYLTEDDLKEMRRIQRKHTK